MIKINCSHFDDKSLLKYDATNVQAAIDLQILINNFVKLKVNAYFSRKVRY